MACARVPLDEQQVTEPGPLGKERTLPALVSKPSSEHYVQFAQSQPSPQQQHNAHEDQFIGMHPESPHCHSPTVLFYVSTQTGKKRGVLCLISPCWRTAPLLRWRSSWNMPSSSLRTWSGCQHCPMTSSGARCGTVTCHLYDLKTSHQRLFK